MKYTTNDLKDTADQACISLRQQINDLGPAILESINSAIVDCDDEDPLPKFKLTHTITIDLDSKTQKDQVKFQPAPVKGETVAHITLEDDDQPELDLEGNGGLNGAGTGDSGAPLEPEQEE